MINSHPSLPSTNGTLAHREARLVGVAKRAMRLIAAGKPGLVVSIPLYRCWWRIRGLDFGLVSLQELGLNPQLSNHHQNGGGPLLHDLLKQLNITPKDAALDLGSGKGGAMITMAQFPFCKVDGVEISADLVEAARKNLAKLKLHQCRVYLTDAAAFTDLDDYTHVFMYNPFPGAVMTQVIANLEASLRRRPRLVRLLYHNPLCEQSVLASGLFAQAGVYEPFPGYRICIYENRAGVDSLESPVLMPQVATSASEGAY